MLFPPRQDLLPELFVRLRPESFTTSKQVASFREIVASGITRDRAWNACHVSLVRGPCSGKNVWFELGGGQEKAGKSQMTAGIDGSSFACRALHSHVYQPSREEQRNCSIDSHRSLCLLVLSMSSAFRTGRAAGCHLHACRQPCSF